MPAAALDALGYPTARSGMYYRAAIVSSLGLAMLLAGGASRVRWGAVVAWITACSQLAFAVWATGFLWPRPVLPVPGAALAAAAAAEAEAPCIDGWTEACNPDLRADSPAACTAAQ